MTNTHQSPLFVEDIHTALADIVRALGGFKSVGVAMRPEKPADEAGRWLADCLNKERRERLDYEQILYLMREGRRIGCHTVMCYLAQECGYAQPVTVEPEDERAELQKSFVESVKAQQRMLERMERLALSPATGLARVA